jgi:RES domain-containing protein
MEIYRIVAAKWASILMGSRRAARWNSKNLEVLYFAQSRSLAVLENIVHRSSIELQGIPFNLVTLQAPDEFEEITIDQLPQGWNGNDEPAYNLCRQLGDKWIMLNKTLLLKVPSVLIPGEFNFLLNPHNPQIHNVKIISIQDFHFDSRIKDV